MLKKLSKQSQEVMTLAADEARKLNHDFVGTEHLLLGLLIEGSWASAGAIERLGATVETLRSEIEKLVQRGPVAPTAAGLPLTPRTKRVIEFASEAADNVSLAQVEPEHLLVGLLREPSGVAGQAMRNLGLQLPNVQAEAFKIRLRQMQTVERAVRPVRTGMGHKRKMREELLAHLSAIYQEELERLNDPIAALEASTRRFGDPAELSRELQTAVPIGEKIDWYIEHWLGWRAPESVVHMMLRTSFVSFVLIVAITGVPILAGILYQGWDLEPGRSASRIRCSGDPDTHGAIPDRPVLLQNARFVLGCFRRTKSRVNATLWSLLAGLIVFTVGLGFVPRLKACPRRLRKCCRSCH